MSWHRGVLTPHAFQNYHRHYSCPDGASQLRYLRRRPAEHRGFLFLVVAHSWAPSAHESDGPDVWAVVLLRCVLDGDEETARILCWEVRQPFRPERQIVGRNICRAERQALCFCCSPPFLSFGRYNRSHKVAADLKLRNLPAFRLAQITALLGLPRELSRTFQRLERGQARARMDSLHPVRIGPEFPHKFLDVCVTYAQPTCHGAPWPFPHLSGAEPLPDKLLDNTGFSQAPPRPRRMRPRGPRPFKIPQRRFTRWHGAHFALFSRFLRVWHSRVF